jgi:hypothetical protein
MAGKVKMYPSFRQVKKRDPYATKRQSDMAAGKFTHTREQHQPKSERSVKRYAEGRSKSDPMKELNKAMRGGGGGFGGGRWTKDKMGRRHLKIM